MVPWVKCGFCLYRFLIFAFFFTLDMTVRKRNNILNEAAMPAAAKRTNPRKSTSQLKVWTPGIRKAVGAKKGPF